MRKWEQRLVAGICTLCILAVATIVATSPTAFIAFISLVMGGMYLVIGLQLLLEIRRGSENLEHGTHVQDNVWPFAILYALFGPAIVMWAGILPWVELLGAPGLLVRDKIVALAARATGAEAS